MSLPYTYSCMEVGFLWAGLSGFHGHTCRGALVCGAYDPNQLTVVSNTHHLKLLFGRAARCCALRCRGWCVRFTVLYYHTIVYQPPNIERGTTVCRSNACGSILERSSTAQQYAEHRVASTCLSLCHAQQYDAFSGRFGCAHVHTFSSQSRLNGKASQHTTRDY